MQLQLRQDELETAVRDYITAMGLGRPIREVTFVATRGKDGVVTEIEFSNEASRPTAVNQGNSDPTPHMAETRDAGETTPEENVPTEAGEEEGTEEPAPAANGKSLFG